MFLYSHRCNSCSFWLCFGYSLFYSALLPENLCPFWVPTAPFTLTVTFSPESNQCLQYQTTPCVFTEKQWLKHQCQAMSLQLKQIVMTVWSLLFDFLLHNYARSKARGTYHDHINDVSLSQYLLSFLTIKVFN